jgi:hypothetical protein
MSAGGPRQCDGENKGIHGVQFCNSGNEMQSCVGMTARLKSSRLVKVTIGLLVVSCVASIAWLLRDRVQPARRQWKEQAIPAIARRAEDKPWRLQEIEIVTKRTNDQRVLADGWLTDKLILMENGEWLVYQSHCSKEEPHIVRDIFLAKGSDGKWYYSTFHFCIGMVSLIMLQETRPSSLAAFAQEYNLREFDGRSDECLKQTKAWPASWDKNRKSP